MKKILLVCAIVCGLGMMTACKSGNSISKANKEVAPMLITSISQGVFPTKPQFENEFDSLFYARFSIDTSTLFFRCNSDTLLVGYALVPKGFDTLRYLIWVHDCDFAKFKPQVTLDDLRRTETTLAKCINKDEMTMHFGHIKTRYWDYGRQYLFFYNKEGDLCVKVNCSCDKYDWLFSRRYTSVCDGGDCYWQMAINLDKGVLLNYYINGYA